MICVKGRDWEKYRNVRGGTARLFWLFFIAMFHDMFCGRVARFCINIFLCIVEIC